MSVSLPDVFPQNEIVVSEEEHAFEDDDVLEYTLDKAPIDHVINVSGDTVEEFEQGVDYILSNDNTSIIWQKSGNNLPAFGSSFFVTYNADSILSRYVDSGDEEFQAVEDKIDDIVSQKFIENTSNENLDEVGKLFGETIGSRSGRSEPEYRTYLKSVVQSFLSRGTRTGIRLAVSAATDIPIEKISIKENFADTEYEIIIENNPQLFIPVPILVQIAEISDPSGVNFATTRYKFFEGDDSFASEDQVTNIGIVIDTAGTVAESNWDVSNWDTTTWDPSTGTSAQLVADTDESHIRIGNVSPDSFDKNSWDTMDWDAKDGFEATKISDDSLINVGKTVDDDSKMSDTVSAVANDATFDDSSWDSELVWS